MKKEVTISLDEDILEEIERLKKENFDAKRSTIINSLLRKCLKLKSNKKK